MSELTKEMLSKTLMLHRGSGCFSRRNSTVECDCGENIYVPDGFDQDGYENEEGAEWDALLKHALSVLDLPTEKLHTILSVLKKHYFSGVIHSGENWVLCRCGVQLDAIRDLEDPVQWSDTVDQTICDHAAELAVGSINRLYLESKVVWVEPPEGWFTFGTHVDQPVKLEFSEDTSEDGLPLWERPIADEE